MDMEALAWERAMRCACGRDKAVDHAECRTCETFREPLRATAARLVGGEDPDHCVSIRRVTLGREATRRPIRRAATRARKVRAMIRAILAIRAA